MSAPPLSNKTISYGIIVESWRLFDYMHLGDQLNLTRVSDWKLDNDYFEIDKNNRDGGVIIIAQGASIVADALERLASSGAETVVRVGTAGSLAQNLDVGDIFLALAASRDEGTSVHYLPVTVPSTCDFSLASEVYHSFSRSFPDVNIQRGTSWTTDGRWMEDDETIAMYQRLSVATVDMETSALYAVASYRRVNALSISIISDLVHTGTETVPKGVNDSKEDWLRVTNRAKQVILKLHELAAKSWQSI